MNSIWFPVPVALFLRRVVNVLSTLSIAHHYLPNERAQELSNSRQDGWSKSRADEGGWTLALAPAGGSDALPPSTGAQVLSRSTYSPSRPKKYTQRANRTGISLPWLHWRWPSSPAFALFGQWPARRDADKSQPQAHPTKVAEREHGSARPPEEEKDSTPNDTIHRLIRSPVLYDPLHPPRFPIVLCHGLYGFDVRGPTSFPAIRMHYWSSVRNILRKTVGAEVIMTSVPRTGSISERAAELDRFLQQRAHGRGVNLMAHSMGGLDGRHLITHIQPTAYTPLSLTTIATPHRGSAFMDWCAEYLGLGRGDHKVGHQDKDKDKDKKKEMQAMAQAAHDVAGEHAKRGASASSFAMSLATLPSSFTTLLLSMFDSPAYANLTTAYLTTVFNPSTPDDPRVKYFSVGGRLSGMNVWHPLWLPKTVADGAEERDRQRLRDQSLRDDDDATERSWEDPGLWGNDGLVTVQSARWGEYLGTMEGCDHWQMRGASGLELGNDLPPVSGGDGWGLGDWGRFVRLLGRAEKRREQEKKDQREGKVGVRTTAGDTQADAVLKASTDKLSAVVDWLVDQRKSDLEKDEDLERFYVALARKLYDEGL
ncbi:Alpha/Beta hydrolase protein [Amylostereum chailletii]|nr:Alpha/Beta hydrolase protein [Amylostereum chailletii]